MPNKISHNQRRILSTWKSFKTHHYSSWEKEKCWLSWEKLFLNFILLTLKEIFENSSYYWSNSPWNKYLNSSAIISFQLILALDKFRKIFSITALKKSLQNARWTKLDTLKSIWKFYSSTFFSKIHDVSSIFHRKYSFWKFLSVVYIDLKKILKNIRLKPFNHPQLLP